MGTGSAFGRDVRSGELTHDPAFEQNVPQFPVSQIADNKGEPAAGHNAPVSEEDQQIAAGTAGI